MKQVYKDTFNRLSISEEANQKLMQIPYKITNKSRFNKHGIAKFAYAMIIIVLLTVPTITVMAANGVDIRDLFGSIFGEKAKLIQENTSLPEIDVLSNTFDNIDITITGITGDSKLIYIAMDIYKKDGSSFIEDECDFDEIHFTLKQLNDRLNEIKRLDFNYLQSYSSDFFSIPDENIEDNKRSFAYVINIETEIDGRSYYIPGETYYLKFSNFDVEDDFGYGLWEAEFTVNYKEADALTFEVNKTGHMPRWGTDEDYNPDTEMLITNIELSPFALRYECEYDNSFDSAIDHWKQIYLVMEDGSIIGDDSFKSLLDRIMSDTGVTMSWGSISGGKHNDNPWKYRWIFSEPIDILQVKSIHFGSLSIDLHEYIE